MRGAARSSRTVRHPVPTDGNVVQIQLHYDLLNRNIAWYHRSIAAHGLSIRAHVKGHRIPEVSALQLAHGACGIVAQTAREALHHVREAGATDVVIARPTAEPWRLEVYARLAAELHAAGARMVVQVTDRCSIAVLARAAERVEADLAVRLEVDVGAERGLSAGEVHLAARDVAGAPRLRLDGVAGYYSPASPDDVARWAHGSRTAARVLVAAATRVRAAGIDCPVVSVGGTVNGLHASSVSGVTEVTAGAYALADRSVAGVTGCVPALVVHGLGSDSDLDSDTAELLAGTVNDWDASVSAATTDLLPVALGGPWSDGPVALVPEHICPLVVQPVEIDVVDGPTDAVTTRWSPALLPEIEA